MASSESIADRLNALLEDEEGYLVRWLRVSQQAQGDVITDAEIEAAIASGEIDHAWQDRWQQSYATYINEHLAPKWEVAADAGRDAALEQLSIELLDDADFSQRLSRWVESHGGELAVGLSQTQHDAMRAVLRHHIANDPLATSELATLLRSVIGLTPRQAESLRKLRASLVEDGLPLSAIERQVAQAAAHARRVRATRIARTEMARAYNQAMHSTVESIAAQGGFEGPPMKTWYAQLDERTCRICGPLHGSTIALSDEWVTSVGSVNELPPAHPGCRCVVLYDAQPAAVQPQGLPDVEEADVSPAGVGSPKHYITAKPTDRMVCQEENFSCGLACARQLLLDKGIDVPEVDMHDLAVFSPDDGEGVYIKPLGRTLAKLDPGAPWVGGITGEEHFNFLLRKAPFIAMIHPTTGAHYIIVDRLEEGDILRVRDPWGPDAPGGAQGLDATMELAKFFRFWEHALHQTVFRNG